jgi:hypothetical protein
MEKGIKGLGSLGDLTGAFMSIALATSMLSMLNGESAFGINGLREECILYSNNNFFKNKYRCSIVKKDSLKDLKIKRYY